MFGFELLKFNIRGPRDKINHFLLKNNQTVEFFHVLIIVLLSNIKVV